MSIKLSLSEQRLEPDDFLVINGIVFSLYTKKEMHHSLINFFKSALITEESTQEAITRATHFFTASVIVVDPVTRATHLQQRYAAGSVTVHAPDEIDYIEIDELVADTLPSVSIIEHSNAYKEAEAMFRIKYPLELEKQVMQLEEDYEYGNLDRSQWVQTQLNERGVNIDYKKWQKDSVELHLIDPQPWKTLKIGIGVLLMREVFRYFLSRKKKRVMLKAAKDHLVPYYERYGFRIVHKITGQPTKNLEDSWGPSGYRMILFDIQTGYEQTQMWAQSKIEQVKVYWERLNPAELSGFFVYSIEKSDHKTCDQMADFLCGHCKKAMYRKPNVFYH